MRRKATSTQTAPYVIVGAGLTADSACRGIRERDPEGRILVFGDEPHPPYLRPPLTKALWRGKDEATIWRDTADLGVDVMTGHRAVGLDLEAHTVTDDAGAQFGYARLLLATGGKPRRLPFGGDEVVYFRTLDDYRRLRSFAERGGRVCVIGGGFIGSEIAAALSINGCSVTMVFPESGIGARIFPEDLAAALVEYYRDRGVEVIAEASVVDIATSAARSHVGLGDGRTIECDLVVAGIGIEPNVELAAAANLPVENGIVVDAFGRTGREDVFAAGDVARFPVSALGTEMRVEHEDHAKSHGRAVGANMAGAEQPYEHLPFFYSDLFDVGYEAVGELDSRLTVLVDWNGEPESEGTIVYVDKERRPRGVLLWNRFGHLDAARDLIRSGEPVRDEVRVE